MTAREVWEGMLTELSKVNAPSMLLQDFNYFFNKAINQYINKRYNIYDVNLQTTDDLRVLKTHAILKPEHTKAYGDKYVVGAANLYGGTYEVTLPDDYLHILNCVCIYKLKKSWKCWDKGNYAQFPAKRLTADSWSIVINDYYNRPLPYRPYFYIHNVNINTSVPTNPITDTNPYGTDIATEFNGANKLYIKEDCEKLGIKLGTTTKEAILFKKGDEIYCADGKLFYDKIIKDESETTVSYEILDLTLNELTSTSNFDRVIHLGAPDNRFVSTVDRDSCTRYGNASKVRMELRCGADTSVFELEDVHIDYIKSPLTIRLTQELVNLTEDTSQIMEFPDYVCQEIINELTMLVMENTADPRLQTNLSVTQSIANPAQQLTPQPQPQQA